VLEELYPAETEETADESQNTDSPSAPAPGEGGNADTETGEQD